MRGGCGEPFRGPQAVVTHPAAIGVQRDVRIVRTLEPCLLWPDRYRIGASQRTDVKGHNLTQNAPSGPWRIHSPEIARRVAPPLRLLRHSGRSAYARPRVTPLGGQT